MKKFILDLTVTENLRLHTNYVLLKLTSQTVLPEMLPGQFAEIRIDGSPTTFLRRPISINYVDRQRNEVWFLIQLVGDGTKRLAQVNRGEIINVVLPLGNSFTMPEKPSDKLLLVGGGVGTAPMLYLGEQLAKNGSKPTFLLGARSNKDLLQLEDFAAYGEVYTTTEDGSHGEKGYVTQHSILNKIKFEQIYTCGPKPMMMAVAKYAKGNDINCEVSLENTMACGIGACLCCVENTTEGHCAFVKKVLVFNINKLSDLSVNIGKLQMKNPVMTASGTFGYGEEFADFIDITRIGGIIVKGTTLHKREGNPYPRMAETPSGMLNAVGLQNKGVEYFSNHIYPRIKDIQTHMIVNVSGSAIEDYVKTAEIINELDKIPAIELNISCPNVKQGGMAFGVTTKGVSEVVQAVRSAYKKTLIVKLSPNVTDIAEMARAAEANGADSVSLINTLLGMAIDAERKRPILSTVTGGMSGAAVKPIALRMVWQVAKAVNIPVIGLGGIMNWKDAVEFMLAGASAIQIGTANFIDPAITIKVIDGINDYLERHGCKSVSEIIGALEV